MAGRFCRICECGGGFFRTSGSLIGDASGMMSMLNKIPILKAGCNLLHVLIVPSENTAKVPKTFENARDGKTSKILDELRFSYDYKIPRR